jgi:hypothetical protein
MGLPSLALGRCFSRRGKREAAQIISRGLRFAARREKRALVSLQQFNPAGDVTRIANVAVKTEFRTQERGAQFGNQFFGRVLPGAETVFQIPVQAGLVAGPMR